MQGLSTMIYIKTLTLIFSFVFSIRASADIFGADIPILAQIAATTAKELKATMEILNVSKESVDNIKEANKIINTHRETMNRIEYLVNRAERISNAKVRNHAELNNELRRIRGTIDTSKRFSEEFKKKYELELKEIEKIEEKKIALKESTELPTVTSGMVESRTSQSYSGDSSATHGLNTAINTALTNEILIESSKTQQSVSEAQLEYYKDQKIKNLKAENDEGKVKKFLGGM